MVEDGLTATVIVGAVPLKAVPSESVPEIVPDPVAVMVKLVLPPLQMQLCHLRPPLVLHLL